MLPPSERERGNVLGKFTNIQVNITQHSFYKKTPVLISDWRGLFTSRRTKLA